jgi:replicative DNA helicase
MNNPALPHSREYEEAVLSSVMIDPDLYYDLAQVLTATDFYITRHAWIWEALGSLSEKRVPIDILTVGEELERKGRLGEVGGAAYLTGLVSRFTSSLNVTSYAKSVQADSLRRKMIAAAGNAAKLAYDNELDAEKALTDIHAEFDNITPAYRPHSSPLGDRVFAHAFEAHDQGDVPGVPTGLNGLDKILGGYMGGDLVYVAARPGEGKTGYLITAFREAIQVNKYPALFSMEMGDLSIGQRLVAQAWNLDTYKLRRGRLEGDEWEQLRKAKDWLNNLEEMNRFHINEKPGVGVNYIHAVCKRLKSRGLLDIIFVDYVQLMSAKGENRHQQISLISRGLKEIALDLNVPVVSAAQLRRDAERKQPQLSDLKESGSLEQDADVVIFIWRESDPVLNNDIDMTVKMSVAKHRNGPIQSLIKNGNSLVQFRRSSTRFEDSTGVEL